MINLLPPALKAERRFGRVNRVLVGWSIAVVSLALVCAAIILFSFQMIQNDSSNVKEEISTNQQEITRLEAAQKQIDGTAKQLATIKKLQAAEVNFSEVIPKIGSVIPPGAILTSLSLTGNKDQPLQLAFKLKSQELAAVVRQNLAASELFASADILSVTNETGDVAVEYGYSTSIVVSFEGAKPRTTTAPAPAQGASQ